VLVDAHQDVLSRQTCGEGMPTFYAQQILEQEVFCISPGLDPVLLPILELFGVCKTMDSYGHRKDDDGLPVLEDCQTEMFATYQMTRDAMSLYRALYYNELGMRDNFINFWHAVAERFHDNEHVIGFDPLNEPFPAWRDPLGFAMSFLVGGHFDQTLLGPMYADIYAKMQESNVEFPMVFEPTQIGDFLPIRILGYQLLALVDHVGFPTPPGGEIGSDMHILETHSYCCQLGFDVCSATGEPPANMGEECMAWH
jgi:endoglycosylceramidase